MFVSSRLTGALFAAVTVLGITCSPALAGPRRVVVRRGWAPPPPSAFALRARERAADLEWARHDPPATEIWDGRALNLLFRDALATGGVSRGPTMPLSATTLSAINLVPAGTNTNLGLLKDGGRLSWPLPLTDPAFAEPRRNIDDHVREAVADLSYHKPAGRASLLGLRDALQVLSDKLDARARDLSPGDYIASRRYLGELKDASRTLEDPAAYRYFDRTWTTTVLTVGDLVRTMADRGLEFAPAVAPGDNACYTSLYHSLHDFDVALHDCR